MLVHVSTYLGKTILTHATIYYPWNNTKWAYEEIWVQSHNPLQIGSHRIISLLLHLFTKLW